MVQLLRSDATHPDFRALVKKLDRYLAEIDGDEHAFYAQYNHIDHLNYVLIAYVDGLAVGCAAIKEFGKREMEVKRMFVDEAFRNQGIASKLLAALEHWAKELGAENLVLETGKKQRDAVALYTKRGFQVISNFGQYQGIENSLCFAKSIDKKVSN